MSDFAGAPQHTQPVDSYDPDTVVAGLIAVLADDASVVEQALAEARRRAPSVDDALSLAGAACRAAAGALVATRDREASDFRVTPTGHAAAVSRVQRAAGLVELGPGDRLRMLRRGGGAEARRVLSDPALIGELARLGATILGLSAPPPPLRRVADPAHELPGESAASLVAVPVLRPARPEESAPDPRPGGAPVFRSTGDAEVVLGRPAAAILESTTTLSQHDGHDSAPAAHATPTAPAPVALRPPRVAGMPMVSASPAGAVAAPPPPPFVAVGSIAQPPPRSLFARVSDKPRTAVILCLLAGLLVGSALGVGLGGAKTGAPVAATTLNGSPATTDSGGGTDPSAGSTSTTTDSAAASASSSSASGQVSASSASSDSSTGSADTTVVGAATTTLAQSSHSVVKSPTGTPPPVGGSSTTSSSTATSTSNSEMLFASNQTWTWVNHQPLAERHQGGALVIDCAAAQNPPTENFLTQPAPAAGVDFTLTATMTYTPSAVSEEAGILVWADDANYLALMRTEAAGTTQGSPVLQLQLQLMRSGTPTLISVNDPFAAGAATTPITFRLDRAHGSSYTAYAHAGTSWIRVGTTQSAPANVSLVGIGTAHKTNPFGSASVTDAALAGQAAPPSPIAG